MYIIEAKFIEKKQMEDADKILEITEHLLGTLRMNGQILGREYSISKTGKYYHTYLFVPEKEALERGNANLYVANALEKLITKSTGIPTFYYLMKVSGKSRQTELARKCPSCNGEWQLQNRLHKLFDFKCDKCRVLSNIGWSVK